MLPLRWKWEPDFTLTLDFNFEAFTEFLSTFAVIELRRGMFH